MAAGWSKVAAALIAALLAKARTTAHLFTKSSEPQIGITSF